MMRVLGVAALLTILATAQEFRWLDGRGQPKTAKDPATIPAAEWKGVTVATSIAKAESGERLVTTCGLTLVLEGIQAPDVVSDGTILSYLGEAARDRAEALAKGKNVTIEFEGARRLPDGAFLGHVVFDDGTLLSSALLSEGMVRLCLEESARRHEDDLKSAQKKAQAGAVGVWARVPPPVPPLPKQFRGVGLGLYSQDDAFDYGTFVKEISEIGASHLLVSVPWLMENYQSPDMGPVAGRTASFKAIDRVCRQARERKLGIAFLPLVLLRTGTYEYWRGNIQPDPVWLWFRNYGRYMGRWADVSREHGVALLSVGSEFTTMERHTGSWRAVIANIRSRFAGALTYSANWDHLKEIKWWNDIDLVGMTAYHSLTTPEDKITEPTDAQLLDGWIPIRDRLVEFIKRDVGKPFFFTEVGYPSQDGCNHSPWNYFLAEDKPDPAEQAACFRAYFTAWKDAPPEFRGDFMWNWFRTDTKTDDHSYSIWKKPAYEIVKQAFAARKARER